MTAAAKAATPTNHGLGPIPAPPPSPMVFNAAGGAAPLKQSLVCLMPIPRQISPGLCLNSRSVSSPLSLACENCQGLGSLVGSYWIGAAGFLPHVPRNPVTATCCKPGTPRNLNPRSLGQARTCDSDMLQAWYTSQSEAQRGVGASVVGSHGCAFSAHTHFLYAVLHASPLLNTSGGSMSHLV